MSYCFYRSEMREELNWMVLAWESLTRLQSRNKPELQSLKAWGSDSKMAHACGWQVGTGHGRKSQFFLMWTLSQSNLTVLMTWRWAFPRVSPQRKSKKQAAVPFMTKPWKSTLVPQCSTGYTDQLYSRWKGLHWGMCIRRQHSLGPSWGLATTITHNPAHSVLPPDVSTTHTLITSRSLLKSYFTGEAFPRLSLRMESLSPFSLLVCCFIFPYCT